MNSVFSNNWNKIKDTQLTPVYLVEQISLLNCELNSKTNQMIYGSENISQHKMLIKQLTKLLRILNLDFSNLKVVLKYNKDFYNSKMMLRSTSDLKEQNISDRLKLAFLATGWGDFQIEI